MQRWNIYLKFRLLLIVGHLVAMPSKAATDLNWLAFGDLRGHLEPCGCDPRTDLGGLKRLDAYIARERAIHPDVMLFHLGNAPSDGESDIEIRKNPWIERALGQLHPTASLVNLAEFNLIRKGVLSKIDMPFILTNLSAKSTLLAKVAQTIETPSAIIFGILELTPNPKELDGWSPVFLQSLRKMEKSKSAKKRILLFSGSDQTLKKIIGTKYFDDIISSNPWPHGLAIGDMEHQNEDKLIRFRDGTSEVLAVPAGGQGVLRSPNLQQVESAKSLLSILSGPSKLCSDGISPLSVSSCSSPSRPENNSNPAGVVAKNQVFKRNFVVWLKKDEEVGVSTEMESLFKQYRDSSSTAYSELIAKKKLDLASSPYIGSEACATCHASSFAKWKESKHASAFTAIKNVVREKDPECVSCHVVGFSGKGGFVSEDLSPKLAHVQCESCHGPRKVHAENPGAGMAIKGMASKACSECHTPPHSPGFDYPKYWKLIEHK